MCPEQIILDVFLRFLLITLRTDDAPVDFQRNFHTGYTGKKFASKALPLSKKNT